jgi:hypothetical protein
MPLTPSQQLLGLALFRISPVFLAAVSGTFSYISHEFVAAFKHRAVSFEARQAVLPGWWDHIRPVSLPVIWLSFIPNFIIGLANAKSSTLWGWLGDGSVGAVGPLAATLYRIGAIVSIAYFPHTIYRGFVPLQTKAIMVESCPKEKREHALNEFIRMDFQRGWTAGFPVCVLFVAAVTVWVADQISMTKA